MRLGSFLQVSELVLAGSGHWFRRAARADWLGALPPDPRDIWDPKKEGRVWWSELARSLDVGFRPSAFVCRVPVQVFSSTFRK